MTWSFVALVVFATATAIAVAWTLGANSNSPPLAPAIGAHAISTMQAAFLIGALAALGAITQGGAISATIGEHLTEGVVITPLAATAGLLVAASFMGVGIYTGYPVPAAFATTGAMVGVGISLGGDPSVDTLLSIGTFWILVPPVSGGLAYISARLLRSESVAEPVAIPLLGAIVAGITANIRFGVIPARPGQAQASVAGFMARQASGPEVVGISLVAILVTFLFAVAGYAALRRRMVESIDQGIKAFLVILGGLVAFSSGGSQVGLATGPLEQLFRIELGLPGIVLLAIGAGGILAGAWMASPRLLQATSREYAQLGVRRSIAALVPGFIIAQTAIALGIPISLNNIILSGIVGSGLAAGSAGISRRKIVVTITFWLFTLVASVAIGFSLYQGISFLFGME